MYVEVGPTQPFKVAVTIDGVTIIVPEIGVVPVLVAVKLGTLPLPPEPNPIAVFELVQV